MSQAKTRYIILWFIMNYKSRNSAEIMEIDCKELFSKSLFAYLQTEDIFRSTALQNTTRLYFLFGWYYLVLGPDILYLDQR